jgi:hypothetical protein
MDDPNIVNCCIHKVEMEWGNKNGKNYFMVLHFADSAHVGACAVSRFKTESLSSKSTFFVKLSVVKCVLEGEDVVKRQ